MKKILDIIIYETPTELYKDYVKHSLYNYPIKCKKCNSNINNQPLSSYYTCDCKKFNVTFNIGIFV